MASIPAAPPPMIPPRPVNDARSAFFRGGVPAPVAQAAAQPTPAPPVQPRFTAQQAPSPDRPLRPGSIIDIKV